MNNYRGYDYIVLEWKREITRMINGYVRIPEDHPLYKKVDKTKAMHIITKKHNYIHKDYDEASKAIDVHGGFTFAGKITQQDIDEGWEIPFIPGLWIGWDYAHSGDCFIDHDDPEVKMIGLLCGGHHWKKYEVDRDCKDVIDKMISMEKNI